MVDKEKVIKGLTCCTSIDENGFPVCEACPYNDYDSCSNLVVMLSDALEVILGGAA